MGWIEAMLLVPFKSFCFPCRHSIGTLLWPPRVGQMRKHQRWAPSPAYLPPCFTQPLAIHPGNVKGPRLHLPARVDYVLIFLRPEEAILKHWVERSSGPTTSPWEMALFLSSWWFGAPPREAGGVSRSDMGTTVTCSGMQSSQFVLGEN